MKKCIIIHFNATDTQGRSSEQKQQNWKMTTEVKENNGKYFFKSLTKGSSVLLKGL